MSDPSAESADTKSFNPFGQVSRATWRQKVEADLKGRPFESLAKADIEGLERQVLYTVEDAPAALPAPGRFPFARGGTRAEWGLIAPRLDARTESVVAAAERAIALGAELVWLEAGDDAAAAARALDVARSLPGAMVLVDADRCPRAANEDDIGPWVCDLLAPIFAGRRDALDDFEVEGPAKLRPLVIDLRPVYEAGGGPVAVLSAALGAGAAVLRAGEVRGATPEELAPRLVFVLASDLHFFDTVAMLRAARSLWAQVLAACGVPRDACEMQLRVDAGLRDASDLDPWINTLRATTMSFAAQVAGADWVGTMPFDLAEARANASGRLAVNTPLILREESHATAVADPAGGSHFVEARTQQLRGAAWAQFQADEAAGGWVSLLADGEVQRRLHDKHTVRAAAVASGRAVRVGATRFPAVFDATAQAPRARNFARLAPVRTAAPFEALRRRAAEGSPPRLALLTLGPLREHKARADFARDLFAAGGIELAEPRALAEAEGFDGVVGAVVVGTDEAYAEAAEIIAGLKAGGLAFVGVVTRPPKPGGALEAVAAAVDACVHMRADALALCARVHDLTGVVASKGGGQ